MSGIPVGSDPAAHVATSSVQAARAAIPRVSVVIPCFNEEGAIRETIESLVTRLGTTDAYELIVVDDGSTDGSSEILRQLEEENSEIVVLSHERNRGYGAALKTGISRASAELVAMCDADGTYPHELIPDLVRECADADMVVGARTGEEVEYSWLRAIPKRFLRAWSSWIAGQRIPDINSGLRVFRRAAVLPFFGILPDGFSFTTTITLAMLTNWRPVKFVPINYKARTGRSKIRPVRDTLQFMVLILRTGMYFAPMRVLFPGIVTFGLLTTVSAAYDVWIGNLTDKTVLLLVFTVNMLMVALLADMIDKRSPR